MELLLLGLNHTTAPLAVRERLYISASRTGQVLHELCHLPGVEEAVVLSTCNRTEIYTVCDDLAQITGYLAQYAHLAVDELQPHLYTGTDSEAAVHLFRVAAGLDSQVIGETQIIGQVADALALAQQHDAASRYLNNLFQHAIATGKRARSETGISEGAFSTGRIAVDLATTLFTDLQESPVLLLGAGQMAEVTARHLAERGASPILVANRTYAQAAALANALHGEAIFYENLEEALTRVDIVISSTSAPHAVIQTDLVARAMAHRDGRPLCLIDIAVPRDIEAGAGEVPGVRLYNIDDLQIIAEQHDDSRRREIPLVEEIIANELERWRARQAGLTAAPIIAALHDACEQVRLAEIQRMQAQLAGLTPEQQQAVDTLTAGIVAKILHTPTVKMKEALAQQCQQHPLPLICTLFDLSVDEKEEAKETAPV